MDDLIANSNVVLIGMPGVGKSTVGVLLAAYSGRSRPPIPIEAGH